jgi:hypothetical protein
MNQGNSAEEHFLKGPLLKQFLMFFTAKFLDCHIAHLLSEFSYFLVLFERTLVFFLGGNIGLALILAFLFLIFSNSDFILPALLDLPSEV